ncbi:LysR family transcriptional regulator [Streptomyces sp. RLA2-12]|nr:LysR family transcriptional regulator [Streptomyces sp. RLA2-12]
MDTRELAYFVAVAETLHFGQAAESLGITQPPLSRAIAQLERRVGVPLLERTTRQVRLTAAGEVFLAECARSWRPWTPPYARRAKPPSSSGSPSRYGLPPAPASCPPCSPVHRARTVCSPTSFSPTTRLAPFETAPRTSPSCARRLPPPVSN